MTRYRPKNKVSIFLDYRVIIISLLTLSFIMMAFMYVRYYDFYIINGSSMSPTLNNGDIVLLRKEDVSQSTNDDIIVFNKPESWRRDNSDNRKVIKRVIGKPGDRIQFFNQHFMVNNRTYNIPQTYSCQGENLDLIIPPDKYFVLGDNSEASIDSRYEFCQGNDKDYLVDRKDVIEFGKIVVHI